MGLAGLFSVKCRTSPSKDLLDFTSITIFGFGLLVAALSDGLTAHVSSVADVQTKSTDMANLRRYILGD